MRKKLTRVLLVSISVLVLALSVGITVSAAGNGNGNAGSKTDVAGSSYQNKWQYNETKGNKYQSGNCTCSGPAAENNPLSEEEREWLTYMREEEKLARDVYLVLYDEWGARVFENIAASEQKHMDAINNLLEKYGIEDPVEDENISGNFTFSKLNDLYDELTTRGLSSLKEAYQVGVDIETLDIEDLGEAIAASGEHTNIVKVYNNLLKGSYNHLAAFNLHLDQA